MNISFDTASLSANEARGLIAFLSSLLPSPGQQVPQISPPPETVTAAPVSQDQPEPPLPALVNGAADTGSAGALPEAQPTPVVNGAAEPPAEPARRGRKPKVTSIDAGANTSSAAAQTPAPTEVASAPAPVIGAAVQAEVRPNGAAKAITADELRAALNGFIQRHSMEDAIAKLKAFGCNRVTEALNLEPARLSELAQALNA